MEYAKLVEVYEKIEATTKRLEITEHLSQFFRTMPPSIIHKVVYLTQGRLYPDFYGIELGLADKLVLSSINLATGIGEKDLTQSFIKTGDLGSVAEDAVARKKQRNLFSEPLSIERVYGNLESIAKAAGAGSQDVKMKLLVELLHDSMPLEAKYIARTVLGNLRLGVADMTILDALAKSFAEKADREKIERAYNVCSDIGLVAKKLVEKGIAGMGDIRLTIGIPVHSMLAERLSSIEEILEKMGGECAFEHKYDGLRIQAHIDRKTGTCELFSRRLERVTGQFPDIVESLTADFRKNSGILDGEAVPVDLNTGEFLPFQEVSRRRGRKYDIKKTADEVPVHLFLFDCLSLDGDDFTTQNYQSRRAVLEGAVLTQGRIRLANRLVTSDAKAAEQFFTDAIAGGLEGIVAKSVRDDSVYKAGARGWQWIKYKKDYKSEMYDTVDLVVVGAFAGQGRRAGGYGALLMASYEPDNDVFETVCKLGSGFDDKTVAGLPEKLKPHLTKEKSRRVISNMKADFWFEPEVVAEVLGAEITLSPVHTCAFGKVRKGAGLAVRFPRFTGKWRDDKGPTDAMTSDELVQMYEKQLKKVE
jgi:DNA ligase-1